MTVGTKYSLESPGDLHNPVSKERRISGRGSQAFEVQPSRLASETGGFSHFLSWQVSYPQPIASTPLLLCQRIFVVEEMEAACDLQHFRQLELICISGDKSLWASEQENAEFVTLLLTDLIYTSRSRC